MTLGVAPSADEVVIHAAYRALMRRHHPDLNPGADGDEKVRELAAAYEVLRDPARRSDYDQARLASDPLLAIQHWSLPETPRPAPAGRSVAIAAILLSALAVVWAWNAAPAGPMPTVIEAPAEAQAPAPADPAAGFPALAQAAADLPPVDLGAQDLAERNPMFEQIAEVAPLPRPSQSADRTVAPVQRPVAQPRQAVAGARQTVPRDPPRGCAGAECAGERIGALDRHQHMLFSQSLGSADDARRDLLLANRDGFLARRAACRSEACVAGAYLTHFQDISAIMEGGAPPRP